MTINEISENAFAEKQATAWIEALDGAIKNQDEVKLSSIFCSDSHWRNLSGISWPIKTFSGADNISREISRRSADVKAENFAIDSRLVRPRKNTLANEEVIEAIFRFDTENGSGLGIVRLVPSRAAGEQAKAWTLGTILDIDKISHGKEASGPCGSLSSELPRQSPVRKAYSGEQPDVLVVGGGHAGLTAAVEVMRLGYSVLVLDREKRVGDNWRLRYERLKLHNKTPINHLRYMPFPTIAPDYLPKDRVANWLEAYVDIMGIDFLVDTSFEGAMYDEDNGRWDARIKSSDGTVSHLSPGHIVMASSVSGIPNIPEINTIENFSGSVLHSSEFATGDQWNGRSAMVMGTGTSAHDISQELHSKGAHVTIVQRSPTLVVDIESAQLYDAIYLGDGPALEARDLLNASVPYPVVKIVHKEITREVKKRDAQLLDRLEEAGFRLEFGEDETGWPLKFRTRGGGYYLNVGCSDLIANGEIDVMQASAIKKFAADGVELVDGSRKKVDLVVLATGYKGLGHSVNSFFGAEVASRVGEVWGLDPDYHELRNMWTKTGQPGLWFTGGAFSMCRIYSRCLAMQIDAIESGRLDK